MNKNINGDSLRLAVTQSAVTCLDSVRGAFSLGCVALGAGLNAGVRSGGNRPRVPERVFDPANRGGVCVGRNNVFMRKEAVVA